MAKKKENSTKKLKPLNFNRFWCIWNCVEAAIILTAGIFAIIIGANNKDDGTLANNVLPYIVGGFIAMDAILRVIMTLTKRAKDTEESIMLIGGFELTAAILIMVFHADFTRLIVYAISILLIVIGALLALFSAFAIVKKSKKYFMPILEIVFAAILIAVGVVVLVLYSQKDNNQIVLIVMGIVFCVVAISQLVSTAVTIHKAKKEEKGELVPVKEEKKETKSEPVKEEAAKEEKKENVIEAEVIEPQPKEIEQKDKE